MRGVLEIVAEPAMDLDFNGKLAQSDPNEMQTPICQPLTEPSADPSGGYQRSRLILALSALLLLFIPQMFAQQLAPNQTIGFGNGSKVIFTYLQNFDCSSVQSSKAQRGLHK